MVQLTTNDTVVAAAIDVLNTADPTTTATRRFVVLCYRPAYDYMLFEDLGSSLVKICDLPGEKDTSVTLVAGVQCLTIYVASRLVDVSGAPCVLLRHDVSVANIWPMELAALVRVRNLARILSTYVPAAAAQLAPYTK